MHVYVCAIILEHQLRARRDERCSYAEWIYCLSLKHLSAVSQMEHRHICKNDRDCGAALVTHSRKRLFRNKSALFINTFYCIYSYDKSYEFSKK